MLSYFPKPFSDESIYSIIGRYHLHTCAKSIYMTKVSLFDDATVSYSHCFPTYLEQLSERTSPISNLSKEVILKEHTLWPYFFNFLSDKMVDTFLPLIYTCTKNIKTKRGIIGLEKEIFPKYCPLCNKENIANHGQIFWNRIHQIPSIKICHIHNCFLEEIEISNHRHAINKTIYPPQLELCPQNNPKFNNSILLHEVANKCKNLAQSHENIDLNFKKRLAEIGFSTGNRVYVLKLLASFRSFYQTLNNDSYKDLNFITSAFISGHKLRTLTYPIVLFDHFISNQPRQELKKPFWDIQYFGNGPWQCQNKLCSNYKKYVIQEGEFKYRQSRSRTIGKFTCACGMTYALSYQIKNNAIVNSFLSLRPACYRKIFPPNRQIIESKRRLFWDIHSRLESGQEIRNATTQIRAWMKKNDLTWYQRQQAKLEKLKLKVTHEKRKLECEQIFNKIKATVSDLRNANPKFRVSRSNILRRAAIEPIQLKQDMKNYLELNEESVSEYRVRRLKRRAEILRERGKIINRVNLLKVFHQSEKKEIEIEVERILKNEFNN